MSEHLAFAIVMALIAFLAWREWLHARMMKDITSKIKAGSIYEYQMVMDEKPKKEKVQEEKPKTVSDPVLGPTY